MYGLVCASFARGGKSGGRTTTNVRCCRYPRFSDAFQYACDAGTHSLCVCVRARARVCVCVCVCVLIYITVHNNPKTKSQRIWRSLDTHNTQTARFRISVINTQYTRNMYKAYTQYTHMHTMYTHSTQVQTQ
jgi:hypothetical protein